MAPEVVSEAVNSIDAEAEAATARALVERRLPRLSGLPREAQVRRLAGMLARKGYSGGLSSRVISEALRAATDRDGDLAVDGLSAEDLACVEDDSLSGRPHE